MNNYNINKKLIVKEEIKKGKSARQALKAAKYSEGHIRRSTKNRIVKDSLKELREEFDVTAVTVDFVVKNFMKAMQMALEKGDISNYNRANESLGRYLAMFTDKTINENINKDELWDDFEQYRLKNRESNPQHIVVSDDEGI